MSMETCPHCKGAKTFRTWGPYPWSPEDPEAEGAGSWSEHPCPACYGAGVMSPLQMTVYLARGGPAPSRVGNW